MPPLAGPTPLAHILEVGSLGAAWEVHGPGAFRFVTNLTVDLQVTEIRSNVPGALVVAKGGIEPYPLADACLPTGQNLAAWTDLPGADVTLRQGNWIGKGLVEWAVVAPEDALVVLALGPGTFRHVPQNATLDYATELLPLRSDGVDLVIDWPMQDFQSRRGIVVASLAASGAAGLSGQATALDGHFYCSARDDERVPGLLGANAIGFNIVMADEIGLDWDARVQGVSPATQAEGRFTWVRFPEFG
jgi:hypothetical protein